MGDVYSQPRTPQPELEFDAETQVKVQELIRRHMTKDGKGFSSFDPEAFRKDLVELIGPCQITNLDSFTVRVTTETHWMEMYF